MIGKPLFFLSIGKEKTPKQERNS